MVWKWRVALASAVSLVTDNGGKPSSIPPIEPTLKGGGGGGTSDGMERVAKLEAHMEHVLSDMAEVKHVLGTISGQLSELPTRSDLRAWKWQWTAIGFATIAVVIGGIIGGLAWIQPAPSTPAAPVPIVITVPK